MRSTAILRSAVAALLLFATHAASAQQVNVSTTPTAIQRETPATPLSPAEVLRQLARELQLQPHQTVAVRRMLEQQRTQDLNGGTDQNTKDELRRLLTAQQYARLQQLQSAQDAPAMRLIALSR